MKLNILKHLFSSKTLQIVFIYFFNLKNACMGRARGVGGLYGKGGGVPRTVKQTRGSVHTTLEPKDEPFGFG